MKILITGGAGYIGSFTVRLLRERGMEVVVFDNLVCGHREALPKDVPLVVADLGNRKILDQVFREHQPQSVIHFAAYALPGESMTNPYKYLQSNVQGSLNLVETMKESGVKHLVFSSSCTVYGEPAELPVTEEAPLKVVSVYGETKYASERIFNWYDRLFGIRTASLRYFNAAGAALDGSLGEDHRPETHLIPLALRAALQGEVLPIFGNDYPTPDGTCIRDYIHVLDLAAAHLKALELLEQGHPSDCFNLGVGRGYSNLEVVKMVREVTGLPLEIKIAPRRPGDAAAIFASNEKARRFLSWQPRYGLREIVESASLWHEKHDHY